MDAAIPRWARHALPVRGRGWGSGGAWEAAKGARRPTGRLRTAVPVRGGVVYSGTELGRRGWWFGMVGQSNAIWPSGLECVLIDGGSVCWQRTYLETSWRRSQTACPALARRSLPKLTSWPHGITPSIWDRGGRTLTARPR